MARVVRRPRLNIGGRVVEKMVSVRCWEAVAVEYKGVQQLSAGNGHDHPRSEPPRFIPEVALVVQIIVAKFQGACEDVYCHCYPELVARVYGEEKASKTGTNGWGDA